MATGNREASRESTVWDVPVISDLKFKNGGSGLRIGVVGTRRSIRA